MSAEEALGSVLSPHCLAFDILHYSNKLNPMPMAGTSQWPLGSTCISQKVRELADCERVKAKTTGSPRICLAPSIARSLADFTKSDAYQTQLNLFTVADHAKSTLLQDAWKQAFEVCAEDGSACYVPVSTVEHENTQLVWERTSTSTGDRVDLCCYGDDCEAHKLRANQGPLQR